MEITPKTRKDSTDPNLLRIYINVHNGGKHPVARPLVKGIKISKSNWNKNGTKDKKNWVSSKEKDYKDINQQIYDLCIQWEAELKGYTAKELSVKKDNEVTGGRKNFLNYAREFMELRRNQNTKAIDRSAIKKLESYLEEKDSMGLQFRDINQKFIKRYYNWLLDNVSTGSANQYLDTFKNIYRTGEVDDSLNFKSPVDPFKGIKKEKVLTKNKSLSLKEWERFKNAQIPSHKVKMRDSHTMFLYQFWGALRFSDIVNTKWSHFVIKDGKISLDIFTQKTKTRIVREVPHKVIETLLPCILKFKLELKQELEVVDASIVELQKEVSRMQKGEIAVPSEAEAVLQLMKKGFSAEEIEEIINENKRNSAPDSGLLSFTGKPAPNKTVTYSMIDVRVGNLKREQLKRQQILSTAFKEVVQEYPDDFVFNLPVEVGLKPHDQWTEKEDRDRYQLASAKHYARLRHIAKKAGIKTPISSHVARHTAAQFMLDGGASSHEASEYLTHGSLPTTEKYRSKLGNSSNKLGSSLSQYL